ncbi:MAG: cell wall-binding repeat-containing protein, partial [Acidimicrobiales bacterium]
TQTILVSAEDSAGNVANAFSSAGPVTLTVASGPGTLTGCTAGEAISNGVATFSGCGFSAPGNYTLTATDVADGLTAVTSTSFGVTNGTQLVFSTEPTETYAGGTMANIVVSVEDQNGNVVTSYPSTAITLAIGANPGGGALTCTNTTVSTTNGVATFTGCSISKAGNGYTLTANGGVSQATSVGFNVTGVPFQLVFNPQPSAAAVNVGQSFSVQIEDSNGEIVPIAEPVTLSIQNNSGGGTLTCSVPTGDAPNQVYTTSNGLAGGTPDGIAAFSNCALSATGNNYTLNAGITSPSTINVVSDGFDINKTGLQVQTEPAVVASTTSATLNGAYNPGGVSTSWDFEYGTNPNVLGTVACSGTSSSSSSISVSCPLTNLTPGLYYFELFTSIGNGGVLSFNTSAVGPVVTESASSITTSSATLNGAVTPSAGSNSCFYYYSDTSSNPVGGSVSGTTVVPQGAAQVPVPISVSSLTAGVTYYFELDCSGTLGGVLTFFTSSSGVVTTTAATGITSTSATLNGTVNPNGQTVTCDYVYGTSSTLAGGTATASFTASGTTGVSEPDQLAGLSPGTTYYFQLQCGNGSGSILNFTTAATINITQIYGSDAIGTSIAISQSEFPTNGSAGGVVLARDDFFSDALAGGPLADSVHGPMLLTEGAPISASIDPRTLAEIQRVLPAGGTVYILGGPLALSTSIDTTLQGDGFKVVRLAGSDEFATAVDIAQQMGNPSTIFEATGLYFYDALSAGPAAIKSGAAILLTNGNVQAPETATYLAAHPGDVRYAIGGPLAAAGADPSATAIYGQDLFSTSAAVAETFFPNAGAFGAATAADFPDALGGGVYMGSFSPQGPILLVNPSAPLPPEIVPYLNSLSPSVDGFVFGGSLAVGPSVLAALAQALG